MVHEPDSWQGGNVEILKCIDHMIELQSDDNPITAIYAHIAMIAMMAITSEWGNGDRQNPDNVARAINAHIAKLRVIGVE